MYSQTFVARDIFAAIWGLGVLSAVAALGEPPRFPFDAQLRDFIAKNQVSLDVLWLEVQRFSCLDHEVMVGAITDAPWSGAASKYPDVDSLKMELVLSSLSPEQSKWAAAFDELPIGHHQISIAIINQMSQLLGALLSAHWSFCDDARSGDEAWESLMQGVDKVFQSLLPIVQGAFPASTSLLDLAYPPWRASLAQNAIGASAAAGYRSYVATWMEHMDGSEVVEGR